MLLRSLNLKCKKIWRNWGNFGFGRSRKIYPTTPPPTKSGRLLEITQNLPGDIGRVPPPKQKSWLRWIAWVVTSVIVRYIDSLDSQTSNKVIWLTNSLTKQWTRLDTDNYTLYLHEQRHRFLTAGYGIYPSFVGRCSSRLQFSVRVDTASRELYVFL